MSKVPNGILSLLAAVWLLGCPLYGTAGQQSAYQEAIEQADRLFQAGNFRNAVERYYFASQSTGERLEQARAYLGLAMSYYYLRDEASAEKWVKKVLEISPRLQVEVPDYPISFVQLFGRVRNEVFKGAPTSSGGEKAVQTAPPRPTETVKPETGPAPTKAPAPDAPAGKQPSAATPPAASPKPAEQVPLPAPVSVKTGIRPGGRFQVMFHASNWTIDPLLNIVESLVKDKVGEEILSQVSGQLRTKYFTLVEASSEHDLDFDSSGSNFGLEVRYFSRGWGGTFSMGLAFDRTSIRLALTGRVKQTFTNGTSAEAEADGALTTDLSSTVLSFRWDISPASRLTPFVILGLGITPFQGRVTYEYAGTYDAVIFKDTISGGEEKTLEELAEEQDFEMIDVFVVLQLALGLDIEIFRGLTGVVEAGLWNGFYLRGGLGYRF